MQNAIASGNEGGITNKAHAIEGIMIIKADTANKYLTQFTPDISAMDNTACTTILRSKTHQRGKCTIFCLLMSSTPMLIEYARIQIAALFAPPAL